MKVLHQFSIILVISMIAEMIYRLLNLPIPTSIYGFILMFFLLYFKIIKIPQVADISNFLLAAMQIMFIPAGVGIMNVFSEIKPKLIPIFVMILVTTLIVTVVTGKVADYVLSRSEDSNE